MTNWIEKLRASTLARSTGWMLLSQGLRLLIQAAYFIIIARSLGVQQYGGFVAAAALTQLVAPFVGFGGNNLLIKNVTRDRQLFPVYWGNLLFATILSGLGSIGLVVAIAKVVLPSSIPFVVIVLVSFAELIFSKLVECAASAFQSIQRLDVTAHLQIVSMGARLSGIAVLAFTVSHPTAKHWSYVYLLTTNIPAALGIIWAQARIGRPCIDLRRFKRDFAEGVYFATSLAAQNIYNDIDKTMLARMATLDAVGIYAAAYRLIDVAFMPVRALLFAAYAGFFRAGHEGLEVALSYMKRLLPKAVWYSFGAFLCLFFCSPIVPHVLGAEYARTTSALRWLSVLPLLKATHYFLADALTCSGYQGYRALVQVIVAGFNVGLNLWLIPAYSWRGACWSSLASDGLLAVSMYLAVQILRATPVRGDVATAPSSWRNSKTLEPETIRRRHIVINADDFGASQETNQAVLQAFKKGLISSASIMANMPGFVEACRLVSQHNLHGRIGLHLNLTEGKPLTAYIADCPRFCDASGYFHPARRVLNVSRKEVRLLEAEIAEQIVACQREGLILTHLDSHHHIHSQFGITSAAIRVAKRFGIRSVRLVAANCGAGCNGKSLPYRIATRAYQRIVNSRLHLSGLAHTEYLGNVFEVANIVRCTTADVEIMVHPRFDDCGRLVDLDNSDLEEKLTTLRISPAELCSFRALQLDTDLCVSFEPLGGGT